MAPNSPSPEPVLLDVEEGVAHVQLNRPASSNAIDLAAARAFDAAVRAVSEDRSVRAVLVTGAGPRFCAGGDVASMMAADDRESYVEELANTLDGALQRLTALDRPVVAGVGGAVAGAGLAAMLSCDIVVAGQGTKFITAYSAVGLTPDCGLSWLLPRAIGQQRALELLLTNRRLSAEEAEAWGLVSEVVPDDQVAGRAAELARTFAQHGSSAHGQARALVRGSWESTRAEVGAKEARVIGQASVSHEAKDLLSAFASR